MIIKNLLSWNFLRYLLHHYVKHQCLTSAGSLAYTTLLSIVPLIIVLYTVMASTSLFAENIAELNQFIFRNLIPTSGETVQKYIEDFIHKADGLADSGLLFVFIAAILLVASIDSAIMKIWKQRSNRHFLARLLRYALILICVPLIIGMSLALSSLLLSMPFIDDTITILNIKSTLIDFVPWCVTVLSLTLLYRYSPRKRVPLSISFIGAIIAATLFEIAKLIFAWYITQFPTYELLYGALAVIPIFLIWLFISWAILLFGVEITYCLRQFSDASNSEDFLSQTRPVGQQ